MTISTDLATSQTLLLVEDDPSLNSAVAYNLRRQGFAVLTALNGEEALELFRRNPAEIRLVLLDLMLPRLSGLHVVRAIRTESAVPVLILTARGQEQDKLDAFNLGADDYMVKPFSMHEMLARVGSLLRRANPHGAVVASTLTRGPIEIDTRAQRVSILGHEMHLRPKEYGLLLLLAMDPDRVFTRQELLDKVWGTETIVDDRTVDVHVSWLRGKLTKAGLAESPIQTAYGSGYRFSSALAAAASPPESLRQGGEAIQAAHSSRFTQTT